jgi:Flp pilus assembly protein TadD
MKRAVTGFPDLEEAGLAVSSALRLKSDDPDTHYYLGRAFLAKGEGKEAAASLREAVRLAPGEARAHNALGVALAGVRSFAEAEAEIRAACKMDPGNSLFAENLACVRTRLQDCALAP